MTELHLLYCTIAYDYCAVICILVKTLIICINSIIMKHLFNIEFISI